MAVDFSNVKSVSIPEGDVKSISIGGTTVWTKTQQYVMLDYIMVPRASTNKLDTGIRAIDGKWTFEAKISSTYASSGTTGCLFGINNTGGYYVGATRQSGDSSSFWCVGTTAAQLNTHCPATDKTKVYGIRIFKGSTYVQIEAKIKPGSTEYTLTRTTSIAKDNINTGNAKVNPQGDLKSRDLYVYGLSAVNINNTSQTIYNGVPCHDTVNGKYGLFDTVSNTFNGFTDWTGA